MRHVPSWFDFGQHEHHVNDFSLCMHAANERRRYNVTSSLIGWTHTQINPWTSTYYPPMHCLLNADQCTCTPLTQYHGMRIYHSLDCAIDISFSPLCLGCYEAWQMSCLVRYPHSSHRPNRIINVPVQCCWWYWGHSSDNKVDSIKTKRLMLIRCVFEPCYYKSHTNQYVHRCVFRYFWWHHRLPFQKLHFVGGDWHVSKRARSSFGVRVRFIPSHFKQHFFVMCDCVFLRHSHEWWTIQCARFAVIFEMQSLNFAECHWYSHHFFICWRIYAITATSRERYDASKHPSTRLF